MYGAGGECIVGNSWAILHIVVWVRLGDIWIDSKAVMELTIFRKAFQGEGKARSKAQRRKWTWRVPTTKESSVVQKKKGEEYIF